MARGVDVILDVWRNAIGGVGGGVALGVGRGRVYY
jgi:hypothetical protein